MIKFILLVYLFLFTHTKIIIPVRIAFQAEGSENLWGIGSADMQNSAIDQDDIIVLNGGNLA